MTILSVLAVGEPMVPPTLANVGNCTNAAFVGVFAGSRCALVARLRLKEKFTGQSFSGESFTTLAMGISPVTLARNASLNTSQRDRLILPPPIFNCVFNPVSGER